MLLQKQFHPDKKPNGKNAKEVTAELNAVCKHLNTEMGEQTPEVLMLNSGRWLIKKTGKQRV